MIPLVVCLLGFCSPPPPDQPLAGNWWLNGNNHYGNLVINLAADGKIDGTMYDMPIAGTFDAKLNQVTIQRLEVARDGSHTAVQVYTGVLSKVEKVKPPHYVLEGTFKVVGGPRWGEPNTDYPWKATALRLPKPASDLKDLQGDWQVDSILQPIKKDRILPTEVKLNARGDSITLRGNQLIAGGQVVATLANDVPSKALADEVGFPHFRLLMLTLPDGKALMCSYALMQDGVELAYPHTTACHRGSGEIVYLKRPSK